jgi:diaminopimelate epimerase
MRPPKGDDACVAPTHRVAKNVRAADPNPAPEPDHRAAMIRFLKLTGSGNDFIFIDRRATTGTAAMPADRIRALCARGTGIGADGIVFLESDPQADVRIRYFNSDGSPAALCGNATLCMVRVAKELAIGDTGHLRIATDSGTVRARLTDDVPSFDVGPIERITSAVPIALVPGERRLGYAVVGVPHLVLEVDAIDGVDLMTRGRALRTHPWTGTPGANVNFVGRDRRGGWSMRTYERGVEAETLACGTGSVACGALLVAWGEEPGPVVRLWTKSGEPLHITVRHEADRWDGSLRGEGRLVFRGELADGWG